MSSSAKGGQRVGSIMDKLDAIGFWTARISASGQTRGSKRARKTIPCDVLAVREQGPNLMVEVGGSGKRVGTSLAEMAQSNVPTFVPCVARCVKRRWKFYAEGDCFTSMEDLIHSLLSTEGASLVPASPLGTRSTRASVPKVPRQKRQGHTIPGRSLDATNLRVPVRDSSLPRSARNCRGSLRTERAA